jgi:hypothetical protein
MTNQRLDNHRRILRTSEEARNAGFCPLARDNCAGAACVLGCRAADEVVELQASLEPTGAGWAKDGPPTGEGGLMTHRQRWKREVGYCVAVVGS